MDETREVTIYTECESAANNDYPSNVKVVWVKGHSKKSEKAEIDLKFQLCDKKARKIMRERRQSKNKNDNLIYVMNEKSKILIDTLY